jgi:hypothetical protein
MVAASVKKKGYVVVASYVTRSVLYIIKICIKSGQKQGVSRRAAKLAENNKKNTLRLYPFLGVIAPRRENAF